MVALREAECELAEYLQVDITAEIMDLGLRPLSGWTK